MESVGAAFFHVDWDSTAAGPGQSRLTRSVYDDDGQPATNVQLYAHDEALQRRVQAALDARRRAPRGRTTGAVRSGAAQVG